MMGGKDRDQLREYSVAVVSCELFENVVDMYFCLFGSSAGGRRRENENPETTKTNKGVMTKRFGDTNLPPPGKNMWSNKSIALSESSYM
jgi:hypothetical protein